MSEVQPDAGPDDEGSFTRELDRLGRTLPLPDEAAQLAALERQLHLTKPCLLYTSPSPRDS